MEMFLDWLQNHLENIDVSPYWFSIKQRVYVARIPKGFTDVQIGQSGFVLQRYQRPEDSQPTYLVQLTGRTNPVQFKQSQLNAGSVL